MPVDDLWYLRQRDPKTGERMPSQRHGRGKRWRARWTDPETGEQRTELFHKKADAERHEANMQADISRGQYIDPRAGKVTVADYGALWRNQQLHRDSTKNLVERAFRLHIDPLLGRLQIGQVKPSHIRGWVKDRSEVLAASSLRLFYSYLVSMFEAAKADKLIGATPCVNMRMPEVDRGDRYIPTPEQVHALAESIAPRYRPVPYLAAGCGLRGGELYGLELESIDFARREITVVQQLKTVSGRAPYLGELKTKASKRTVELPDVVARALREHIEKYPPEAITIEDATNPKKVVERSARLVFQTSTHRPVPSAQAGELWRNAVSAAKLPKGFGLHGLRHYFATLLIHSGASVKTVQLALGHSSPTVTLDTYLHEWPEAIDRTRSLVDRALALPSTPAAA